MKRKLLSFSMALCLSAMGLSAFAQTSPAFVQSNVNRRACTIKTNISSAANGDIARLEVSDKILGDWNSDQTVDNRGNEITLCGWIYFNGIEKSSSETEITLNGLQVYQTNNSPSAGRVLMGHRQGNLGGYGSEPSFSISACGPKAMYFFSRSKDVNNKYSTMSGLQAPIEIPAGWFHLALTGKVDTEKKTLTYVVYVNGESKVEVSADYEATTLPFLYDNVNNWGCDICFGGSMDALFDDLMIWKKALDPTAVKEAMYGYNDTQLAQAKTNGLVGYYLCDDLSGVGHDAYSANVVSDNSAYPLVLTGLYYNTPTVQYVEFTKKEAFTGTIDNAEVTDRMNYPRGGAKFYTDPTGSNEVTWLRNGNENFGYAINSTEAPLYRLDYNGTSISQLDPKYMAVYYNANYDVRAPKVADSTVDDDYQLGVPTTSVTSSYVATGFEYTVKMPSTARKWFTIGFPTEVDLAYYFGSGNTGKVGQDVWLRPNYNFWYNEFNPEYQSTEDNMWNTVSSTGDDDRYYKLANGGTFAVTDDFVDGTFTFYSTENSPVVFRAKNAGYNQSLLPASGKLGFVANPYMELIKASELCPNCVVYQLDDNGLFWPVEDLQVGVFDGVLVYNGAKANAPARIATKATTGVLELEALSDINVRGAKESIEVVTFEPVTVTVYTVGGTMVANAQVEGTETFALPAGIYVVKAVAGSETETFKVVVE